MAATPHDNGQHSILLFEPPPEEQAEVKSDFEQFYTSELLPYLKQVGLNASAYRNWRMFTIGSAFLGVVFIFLYAFLHVGECGDIALMLFLISAIGLYYTTEKQDVFVDDFKTKIIPKILQHISPAAVYQPRKYLSKKEYKSSGLFRRRFTQYDGEDYWQANYKGLDFHCSELLVRYEDATTATTIFKGLFITAGISPYYSSGTYIWPKGDAQLASSIADEHYRMYPMADVQRYPIEDLSFSSNFTVYSTNFSETRQLLTAGRLKNMLVLKERTGRDVRFSFTGGKCFISLAMDEDLLEPSTSRLTDKSAYKEYFFTFLLVFNIIRELELDKLR